MVLGFLSRARENGPDELPSLFLQAQNEAGSAFSSPDVYLEKYIGAPRHIEFQILADEHGNVEILGERECSIQRRHQKVIEECPSPFVDADMRARMGAAAVGIARAAGYYNAGTMEFLADAQRNFYFMEMNTRLQVEHPVTEIVTGLDLVKLQMRIASGEALPLKQEDVTWRGAAVECRIYAEDPHTMLPSPGTLTAWRPPSGDHVRVDSGIEEGGVVSPLYDPLLAKLAVWGETRDEALRRCEDALAAFTVEGVKSNIPLLQRILRHAEFVAGRYSTNLIGDLVG